MFDSQNCDLTNPGTDENRKSSKSDSLDLNIFTIFRCKMFTGQTMPLY